MAYSNKYTKNAIYERMRRYAVDFSEPGRSGARDPVFLMVLEALSEEIFKVSTETGHMEDRLLDKLFSMLVPDINTIARPAHAILHASSREGTVPVTALSEFCHVTDSRKLSFFPVCNTTVYQGDVCYYLCNGSLYRTGKNMSRALISSRGKKKHNTNTFWVGLDPGPGVDNLRGMSFYFDFPGVREREKYLNLLSYTIWKVQDREIPLAQGIYYKEEEHGNDTLDLFSTFDLSYKIDRYVRKLYETCFLSIQEDIGVTGLSESFPGKLMPDFPDNVTANFTDHLLWIEVCCPEAFTPGIMESLHVGINAFPAVSKSLASLTVDTGKSLPVVPLETGIDESLISIKSVVDSADRKYYQVPVDDIGYGTYSMGRGGFERFGKRDGMDYLSRMFDLVSADAVTFFNEHKESDDNSMEKAKKEVEHFVRELRRTITNFKERYEVRNYMLFSPESHDIYFIDYWITSGPQANGIDAGSTFRCSRELAFEEISLFSLTVSQGGMYAPLASERHEIYRDLAARKKMLVSNADIKEFCLKEFSDSISDVRIAIGLAQSVNPKAGFMRTTDVYLKPLAKLEKYFEEHGGGYFERMLKERSPAGLKYRVFIKNELPGWE